MINRLALMGWPYFLYFIPKEAVEMKNSDLNALLKECCLELGIEWVDEPGPAVIDGQKADEYFKDHTIFPDRSVVK